MPDGAAMPSQGLLLSQMASSPLTPGSVKNGTGRTMQPARGCWEQCGCLGTVTRCNPV